MSDENAPSTAPSPWLGMWLRPRRTVRALLDADPKRDVLLLAALAGVSSALDGAMAREAAETAALSDILIVSVIGGAVGGVIGLYVWGWLVVWTGRAFGGAASPAEARAAIAWGNTPAASALILYAVGVYVFGRELFTDDQPRIEQVPGLPAAFLALSVAQIVVGAWGLVVLARAVAEAQRFGAWKGLANVLLSAILPVLVLVGVYALVAGIA